MKVSDAVSGGFFLLFAGLIFYLTKDFRIMPGQNYGAAFFPRTIATVMAFLGAILIVRGLRAREGGPHVRALDWMGAPRLVANFALVIAALLFYIFASDTLGFLITGFVCLMALLLWLRGPSHWIQALVASLLCVIGMHFFFGQVLRVPLPPGVLEPLMY